MRSAGLLLLLWFRLALPAGAAEAAEAAAWPFDAARDAALGGQAAAVQVRRGQSYRTDGNALTVGNLADARQCVFTLKLDRVIRPDFEFSFEYRNDPATVGKLRTNAVTLQTADGRSGYHALPVSATWRSARIRIGDLKVTGDRGALPPDTLFLRFNFYSRIADADPASPTSFSLRRLRLGPAEPDPAPFRFGAGNLAAAAAAIRNETRFQYDFTAERLRIETARPGRGCELQVRLDATYRPDGRIEFEYRNAPARGARNLGNVMLLADAEKNTLRATFPYSEEYRRASLPLGGLRTAYAEELPAGRRLATLRILSSLNSREPEADFSLEIRDLHLVPDPAYQPWEGVRISYSALPLLDWRADRQAERYRLEISRRADFPADATTAAETDRNYYTPDRPWEPGRYHYRVHRLPDRRLLRQDRIVIAPDSHRWRLPDYDFGAVARLPHPRLRAVAAAEGAPAAETVAAARALLDFEVPPNPAPYRAGADPALTAWIDWYGRIGSGVISRTGRNLQQIARGAMLAGDPELTAKARTLALEVARNWDPESGSHMRNGDLHAGELLIGLACCYDAAHAVMTPDERAEVAAALRRRGAQYFDWLNPFRGVEANNHPWARAMYAAYVATVLPEEPWAAEWFDYIARLFAYRFFPSLGLHGENNEGVAYWRYGLLNSLRFVELAHRVAGLNLYLQPWLRETPRFPLYSAPGGYWISFGDSGAPNHLPRGPVARDLVRRIAAETGDREALFYAGVPRAGQWSAAPPLGLPQSVSYSGLGVTIFNTFLSEGRENVALGFHSGRFVAGHQHADQNSFVINAYGDKLAVDGGYYDWSGSRHFLAYSTRSIAHNTVLVDGAGQAYATTGADGATTGFFDAPNFGYVAGDAANPLLYDGKLKRFDRRIVFIKPDYVFVFDQLASAAPRRYSFLLHAQTEKPIDHDPASRNFAVERPLARLDGVMLLPEKAQLRVEKAYDILPQQGYSSREVEAPEPEWILWAEPAERTPAAEFLAALRIGRAGKEQPPFRPEKSENGDAVAIRFAGGVVLFNRRSGQTVELAGIATDAGVAAVLLDSAGQVADAFRYGGASLRWQGSMLPLSVRDGGAVRLAERPPTTAPAADRLRRDGRPVAATAARIAVGGSREIDFLTGTLAMAEPATLEVRLAEPATLPVHFRFGSAGKLELGRIPAGAADATLVLAAGEQLFHFSSGAPLPRIELITRKEAP